MNLSEEDLVLWDLFTKNLEKKTTKNKSTKKKKKIFAEKRKLNPLDFGLETGLSKRKFSKIRKGKVYIEDKLDLHGFTKFEAKKALDKFLSKCIDQDKRLVLIITGKGKNIKGGEIKKNISQWLNEKDFRSKILGFDFAAPKDGGTGAIYIFLKKF